jgi:hypothetical protein
VAEKVQALVALGMLNGRMKDFFDLWAISQAFPFEGACSVTRCARPFRVGRPPGRDADCPDAGLCR